MKTMTDHPEPTRPEPLSDESIGRAMLAYAVDPALVSREQAEAATRCARQLLTPPISAEARRAALSDVLTAFHQEYTTTGGAWIDEDARLFAEQLEEMGAAPPALLSVDGLAIAVRPCIVAALAGLHTVDETTTQVAARVLDYLGKRADLPSPPATPAPVEQLAELEQITRFYHEWVQKAFEAKAELDDIHRLVDPDGVRKDVTTAWLVEQAFNGRGVSSAFFHIALSAAEWNDLTQDQRATLQAWMGMVHDKRRVQPAKKGEL